MYAEDYHERPSYGRVKRKKKKKRRLLGSATDENENGGPAV